MPGISRDTTLNSEFILNSYINISVVVQDFMTILTLNTLSNSLHEKLQNALFERSLECLALSILEKQLGLACMQNGDKSGRRRRCFAYTSI